MRTITVAIWLVVSSMSVPALAAEDKDVAAGEQLYTSQCKICHGNATAAQTGEREPPAHQPVRLAMQGGGATASDAHIAFAPPFGPSLRGVYGRPAGAVEDFQYSSTFLKTLKGMEWNDAALDVWITNSQAWVPGVYMFYKQPDAEVRRKIILYLKANR